MKLALLMFAALLTDNPAPQAPAGRLAAEAKLDQALTRLVQAHRSSGAEGVNRLAKEGAIRLEEGKARVEVTANSAAAARKLARSLARFGATLVAGLENHLYIRIPPGRILEFAKRKEVHYLSAAQPAVKPY